MCLCWDRDLQAKDMRFSFCLSIIDSTLHCLHRRITPEHFNLWLLNQHGKIAEIHAALKVKEPERYRDKVQPESEQLEKVSSPRPTIT